MIRARHRLPPVRAALTLPLAVKPRRASRRLASDRADDESRGGRDVRAHRRRSQLDQTQRSTATYVGGGGDTSGARRSLSFSRSTCGIRAHRRVFIIICARQSSRVSIYIYIYILRTPRCPARQARAQLRERDVTHVRERGAASTRFRQRGDREKRARQTTLSRPSIP